MKLNPVQRDAVRHADHLALVSCPGSGKTRTLVAKLLETVMEVQNSTRLVACITYTNAAVHEIEERLARLNSGTQLCEVETIHSFCLKHIVGPHSWLLSEFPAGFSLLLPESPQFIALVEDVVKRFGLPRRAAGEFEQLGRATDALPDNITEAAAKYYWAVLDRLHLMDFSSIIFWATQIVRRIPYVARGLASRYAWILVDEFQDTSRLQVEILRAVHGHGRTKFFLVGDPYQSIMSFAGARPELLSAFGNEIVARADLELRDNYRSSARILSLADSLCPRRWPLSASGPYRDHAHTPGWYAVSDMTAGIANVFLPEVARQGIELSEVAVLANRWTSLLPLARGLRERRIAALGPGARPYKRSTHLIAPLVEEIAAYLSEPLSRGIALVRRELRRLVQTLTKSDRTELGFAGDVVASRLVASVRAFGRLDGAATDFLAQFAVVLADVMVGASFLAAGAAEVFHSSCAAMVNDIAQQESIHGLRTTTVRDLGLFARGSKSVKLLTMHGSKGREFDAVALIDVFDGHVPFYRARPGDEIEAEGRRLLYVALTRARKVLMVFTLTKPGEKTQPSRFLGELFANGPDTIGD